MNQTWDFESKQTGGDRPDYTKLTPGITRVVFLDDAPYVRWQHWMPEHKRGVTCIGKGCPICEIRKAQKAAGEQPSYSQSMRMAMVVFNLETEKMEILDQGKRFMSDLKIIKEEAESEGKSFNDHIIKIRRTGTGADDTSYRVDISDKYEFTDAQKAKIANKPDLSTFFEAPTREQMLALINGEKPENVFKRETPTEEKEEIEVK